MRSTIFFAVFAAFLSHTPSLIDAAPIAHVTDNANQLSAREPQPFGRPGGAPFGGGHFGGGGGPPGLAARATASREGDGEEADREEAEEDIPSRFASPRRSHSRAAAQRTRSGGHPRGSGRSSAIPPSRFLKEAEDGDNSDDDEDGPALLPRAVQRNSLLDRLGKSSPHVLIGRADGEGALEARNFMSFAKGVVDVVTGVARKVSPKVGRRALAGPSPYHRQYDGDGDGDGADSDGDDDDGRSPSTHAMLPRAIQRTPKRPLESMMRLPLMGRSADTDEGDLQARARPSAADIVTSVRPGNVIKLSNKIGRRALRDDDGEDGDGDGDHSDYHHDHDRSPYGRTLLPRRKNPKVLPSRTSGPSQPEMAFRARDLASEDRRDDASIGHARGVSIRPQPAPPRSPPAHTTVSGPKKKAGVSTRDLASEGPRDSVGLKIARDLEESPTPHTVSHTSSGHVSQDELAFRARGLTASMEDAEVAR